MRYSFYRNMLYAWLALFLTFLVCSVAWIGMSLLDAPGPNGNGMGDFPSPFLLIILASLVAFVVAFVAGFFRTTGWTTFVAVLLVVLSWIVIVLLEWVLGKWGSIIILIAIPAIVGLVVGLVLFLLIVKRSNLGIWVVAVLTAALVGLLWLSFELHSVHLFLAVFLFNVMIVATVVGYKTLITIFQLYKKWTTGA